MKKFSSLAFLACVLVFVSLVIYGCGSTTPGSSSSTSFVQQMAESMANSAAKQSQSSGTTSSIQSSSITAAITPPGFSGPDASGWYTQSVTGMSSFMIRFWADSGETNYITFGAWSVPNHVEISAEGQGMMAGETMRMHMTESFVGADWGATTPEVYKISTSKATYEVYNPGTISLNPATKGTGTITIENTSGGSMSMTTIMYATNEANTHVMLYGSEEASGTMPDPNTGTMHTVTGIMQHITENSTETMYGLLYDSGTLVGVINVSISNGTASGTVLDLSQTPWQKITIDTSQ